MRSKKSLEKFSDWSVDTKEEVENFSKYNHDEERLLERVAFVR